MNSKTATIEIVELSNGATYPIVKVSGRKVFGYEGSSLISCIAFVSGYTKRDFDEINSLYERGQYRYSVK